MAKMVDKIFLHAKLACRVDETHAAVNTHLRQQAAGKSAAERAKIFNIKTSYTG